MNKVSERLSSLSFAVWTLTILMLWLVWGLILNWNKAFFAGFREMNETLVRDWLMSAGPADMLFLKIWFVGLCLIMAIMGVNLVFCTWNRIIKILSARFNGPKLFMLIVHLIFGLVALGHFGGFMLGYRYGNVPLYKDEVFSFEQKFELKVTDIHFVDDPMVLSKSRREIKQGDLSYKRNYAVVTLCRNGQKVMDGRIYLLKPLHYGDVQITLKRFLSPKKDVEGTNGSPGVHLGIACNPVLKGFLFIYPVMILGIVIHLIMTWRRPAKGVLLMDT